MAKEKPPLEKAIGKLISAIQKEWGNELGEQYADFSEDVMGRAHKLLQAKSSEAIQDLLGSLSVRQYLGEVWIKKHYSVKPYALAVEDFLQKK